MTGTVLIVTDKVDLHTDRLVAVMRRLGHDPVRLNFSDIPLAASVSLSLTGGRWTGSIAISSNGRSVDLSRVTSIWWRQPQCFAFPDDMSGQEREFANEETEHVLQGIWSALDCYWVSHPLDIRRASYKIGQLQRAAGHGFDVPRTVVTSDPEVARGFLAECGGSMVYKVLTDPHLAARKLIERGWSEPIPVRVVPTTRITDANSRMLDSVRHVPCQFQEIVPKRSEFRVTLIGEDVFTAEILSQEHENASLDWRTGGAEVEYRQATLPDEIADQCQRLLRSYRLNYGAIDLIQTPDGRFVFLEINPSGQFLFVQERVPELRLVEAMAARLLRGKEN